MFTHVDEMSDPSMMILKGYIMVTRKKRSVDQVNSGRIVLNALDHDNTVKEM